MFAVILNLCRYITAKLSDLGSLKTFASVKGWGLGFTPVYAAPEILSRKEATDPKQDEKADVFAWGVLMWEVRRCRFNRSTP
jgi:hypothetical protein